MRKVLFMSMVLLTAGWASRALMGCSTCEDGGSCACKDATGAVVGQGQLACLDDGTELCQCQQPQTSGAATSASSSSTGTGGPAGLEDGAPCEEDGQLVCGVADADGDANDALHCEDGEWNAVFECPTTQECGNVEGLTTIRCGSGDDFFLDYAVEGAPCASEQSAACTFDQRFYLECQQGIWRPLYDCGSGAVRCDRASVGETGSNSVLGQWVCNGPNFCIVCK